MAAEAADVIYFTLATAVRAGVSLADIEKQLDGRSKKVTRRPGNAKEWALEKVGHCVLFLHYLLLM